MGDEARPRKLKAPARHSALIGLGAPVTTRTSDCRQGPAAERVGRFASITVTPAAFLGADRFPVPACHDHKFEPRSPNRRITNSIGRRPSPAPKLAKRNRLAAAAGGRSATTSSSRKLKEADEGRESACCCAQSALLARGARWPAQSGRKYHARRLAISKAKRAAADVNWTVGAAGGRRRNWKTWRWAAGVKFLDGKHQGHRHSTVGAKLPRAPPKAGQSTRRRGFAKIAEEFSKIRAGRRSPRAPTANPNKQKTDFAWRHCSADKGVFPLAR